MVQVRDSGARDEELARLRREIERAEYRAEEVAAYYHGQMDALRRKAEDEAVRVQASEAGRRRRAEEQVGYLKGELEAARSEAQHAQRRYHELLQQLEHNERDGADQVRAEVDRHRDAARAAWKTAEEEVQRLDEELSGLQRELALEREQRRQLERGYEREVERGELADKDRVKLIQRLKQALKLSEQRRQALEAQVRGMGGQSGEASAAPGTPAGPFAAGEYGIEVDPAAGWGTLQIGDGGELADEFRLMGADESLTRDPRPAAPASGDEAEPEPGARVPAGGEPVSDREAETLMMRLDVDRNVARREAAAVRNRRRVTDRPPELTPPTQEPPEVPPGRQGWLAAAFGGILLTGVAVAGWWIL